MFCAGEGTAGINMNWAQQKTDRSRIYTVGRRINHLRTLLICLYIHIPAALSMPSSDAPDLWDLPVSGASDPRLSPGSLPASLGVRKGGDVCVCVGVDPDGEEAALLFLLN